MTKCEYCGKEIGLLAVRYTWIDKVNNRAMHDKCYKKYNKETSEKRIQTGGEKQPQKENDKLPSIEPMGEQKAGLENSIEPSSSNEASTVISKSETKKSNRRFFFCDDCFNSYHRSVNSINWNR